MDIESNREGLKASIRSCSREQSVVTFALVAGLGLLSHYAPSDWTLFTKFLYAVPTMIGILALNQIYYIRMDNFRSELRKLSRPETSIH